MSDERLDVTVMPAHCVDNSSHPDCRKFKGVKKLEIRDDKIVIGCDDGIVEIEGGWARVIARPETI